MPLFAEKSDRRWQGEVERIGALRSLQRLNDVLREWSLEQSQLDRWDRALARRSQILVAQEDDIRQIYETWQATREAGKQQAFPKVALQKIAEVLREAEAVRGLIRDGMAKLLNLQIQLANRREFLAKIRSDIDNAREESGRQLFVLDRLPLWQAIFSSESLDVMLGQVIRSSRSFAADLSEFSNKYRERILWHALFLVALVLLFRSLRFGPTAPAVEQLGGSARFILERFVSNSFLLALITVPLIYPSAETSILRIAILPSLIPVTRILPRLLPKMFRRGVYWLAAIYVVNFLRFLLPADWLLARLLLLLIAAGGCLGFGLFLRSRAAELSALGSRERLILLAIRLRMLAVCSFRRQQCCRQRVPRRDSRRYAGAQRVYRCNDFCQRPSVNDTRRGCAAVAAGAVVAFRARTRRADRAPLPTRLFGSVRSCCGLAFL